MEPQPLLAAVPRSAPEDDVHDPHDLGVDLRIARADLAVERMRIKEAARRLDQMAERLAVEHRRRLDAEREIATLRLTLAGRVATWPAPSALDHRSRSRLRRAWQVLRG